MQHTCTRKPLSLSPAMQQISIDFMSQTPRRRRVYWKRFSCLYCLYSCKKTTSLIVMSRTKGLIGNENLTWVIATIFIYKRWNQKLTLGNLKRKRIHEYKTITYNISLERTRLRDTLLFSILLNDIHIYQCM